MSRFQIQSDDNWRPMTVTTDDLVKRCADYYQGLVAKGHICIYLFFGKYEGGEGFEVINPEQAGWLDEVRTLLDTGWLPGGFMSMKSIPRKIQAKTTCTAGRISWTSGSDSSSNASLTLAKLPQRGVMRSGWLTTGEAGVGLAP